MIRMPLVLMFSLCISTFSAFAVSDGDQIGYSEIEAQERLQIIKELSYRLDTKFACNLNLSWDDGGSGADLDGYFFIPSVGQSEYVIGGLASQKKTSAKNCVVTVSEPSNNPTGTPRLLATPIDWKQVWNDKGSGARRDGSIWKAIPPDSNYRCLGSIPKTGYNKPNVPNYRCVHKNLTEKIVTKSIVWHDSGSGADVDATMFRLPNTGTFVTVAKRLNKTETYDLNLSATGKPDQQIVESILSERMVRIKADMETQLKEKFGQKKKEAEQKRLAEEIESKRIAEAKRLAEEAESKRIAEETEQQEKLAAETRQQELKEEAEKTQLAEEIEQQEKLTAEAKQQRLEAEAERKRLVEESQQQSPADVPEIQQADMNVEINQQQAIGKEDKEDSKIVLKIIFVSLLLLLMYVIYSLFKALVNMVKGDH